MTQTVNNLPVTPYDKPLGRSRNTGAWTDESARRGYVEDVTALVADTNDVADDLDRLIHSIARNVGHVATRQTCTLTLEAALTMIKGVRQLLTDEADS